MIEADPTVSLAHRFGLQSRFLVDVYENGSPDVAPGFSSKPPQSPFHVKSPQLSKTSPQTAIPLRFPFGLIFAEVAGFAAYP